MTKNSEKYDSGCPIAFGLNVFGDQWTLLIIRDMAIKGAQTYGELLDGWESISTNILAQRLKHLEENGMVIKHQDPENRRSFVYQLTQKARDLAPVIAEIILWSGKYNTSAHAMTDTLKKVRADKQTFTASVQNGKLP